MNDDEKLGISQPAIADASPKPGQSISPRLPKLPNAGPISSAAALGLGRKAVLLVDANPSREPRAKALRAQGVRVDCVSSAAAARMRLATETYSLILVDLGRNVDGAETLVQEIRAKNSRQLVRFLVGSPLFIATSLSGHRPRLEPAPLLIAPPEKASAPAPKAFDFGQRIRDAEAEEKN